MARISRKLGRNPARYDAERVRLISYYDRSAMPPPPASVDWTSGVKSWGVMRNDREPNCTAAGLGHAIQVWTGVRTGKMITVSDDEVMALYNAVAVPGGGANMVDALKRMNTAGLGGHKGIGWAAVDVADLPEFKAATYVFGGTYVGISMPAAAQTQLNKKADWDIPAGQRMTGPWLPGSWGGHAMWVVGYDEKHVYFITWGLIQRATWAWWKAYGQFRESEAYCLVSPPNDWWDATTHLSAIPGIDYKGLCNRLANVADQKEPYPETPPVPPPPPPQNQFVRVTIPSISVQVGSTHFATTAATTVDVPAKG